VSGVGRQVSGKRVKPENKKCERSRKVVKYESMDRHPDFGLFIPDT